MVKKRFGANIVEEGEINFYGNVSKTVRKNTKIHGRGTAIIFDLSEWTQH
tara:strand:+ start:538 stop:687 length:150 start_codon:yes stop_codon:yes gene_type:complete